MNPVVGGRALCAYDARFQERVVLCRHGTRAVAAARLHLLLEVLQRARRLGRLVLRRLGGVVRAADLADVVERADELRDRRLRQQAGQHHVL